MGQVRQNLLNIYQTLLEQFGPQNWWPVNHRWVHGAAQNQQGIYHNKACAMNPSVVRGFEICVGAILTQNTSWKNVERAIANLYQAKLMSFEKLCQSSDSQIAELIRPAGYFNLKTKRLRNFLNAIQKQFDSFEALFDLKVEKLREFFLSISGIGPETADSMCLYAFGHPVFVVDAYTKRLLVRHGLIAEEANYFQIQEFFESHLERDEKLFNEYHALIVKVGSEFCKKSNPKCVECPLRIFFEKT